jgi:hypothetical protein
MFDFGFHFFGNSSGGFPPAPPSTDFIIKVKTDNVGTSADDQFTLPTTTGTYDYNIDWGDGVVENITSSASQTHTYPVAGEYTIKISGTFPRIFFNNGGDRSKLLEIINFGDVGWTNLNGAFHGCTNLDISATATGNFDLVTTASVAFYLSGITRFPTIDFPICTTFSSCWRQTAIVDFPAIDMPLGSAYDGAWFAISALDTFGACNMPSATNIINAFRNCGTLSSFAMRNFYAMTNGDDMFRFTTIPTADCSDIYITQRANNANTGVSFNMGNSKYNASASTARGELVSIQSWSLIDGGLE